MANVADLVAVLRANTTDFNAKMALAEKQLGGVGSSASNMSKVGAVAFGALAAGAAAFGAIAVQQAQEQEVATARLKQAISNIGESYSTYSDKIGKAEDAAVKLGFADDEVTAGLGKLVPATKNVNESIKLMSLAEDIARGRHIDLASATDLLVKVQTGHVALLGRIGINVKDANGQLISQEEAVKRLTAMYGGQASAYTETFAGKIAVLRQEFAQFAEKIGFILIPILLTLMTVIGNTIGWFEKHKVAAIALAVIIGGPLVYAMLAFMAVKIGAFIETVVTAFWTMVGSAGAAVESLAAFAVAAAPFLVVAAGIAAAVFAIGYPMHLIFGSGGQMDEMLSAYKKGQEEGKKFADVIVAGANVSASPLATMRASLEDLRSKQAELTDAAHKGNVEFGSGVEAYSRNEAAIKGVKKAIADYKQQQAEAAAADRQRVADVKAVADGTVQLADATQAAKKAIQDYQNTVIAAQGGEIGRQQAILNVTTAQNDYNAAVAQYGPNSTQAQAAALNLQQAQLGVVSSSLSAQDAQSALNDAASKNPALIQAMILKLQDEITKHGDTTGAIQAQIDKLHDMQFTVDGLHGKQIAVNVDNYQAVMAIIDVQRAIESIPNAVSISLHAWGGPEPHAAGGVFTMPHVGLVAEAGPEAIVPLNNPGRAAQVMSQAGLFGGGGGMVNHITVNAGMGADGQQIAAAIADELAAFQKRGGSVPWTKP